MIYNGDITEIIKAIEHIKIDYNISNNQIAEYTNKSKQTISNILKGRQPNMTLDSLLTLCNAINCDLIIDIKRRENDTM